LFEGKMGNKVSKKVLKKETIKEIKKINVYENNVYFAKEKTPPKDENEIIDIELSTEDFLMMKKLKENPEEAKKELERINMENLKKFEEENKAIERMTQEEKEK
jgi:Tfp pilus assembly protein PilP